MKRGLEAFGWKAIGGAVLAFGAWAGPALAESGSRVTASTAIRLATIDYVIVTVYLLGIILLGCLAGLRRKGAKGSDYFLASKSLTWPFIGLALFATNISTIHLVSFAQNGYTSGLAYGNYEWMAAFTLVILSLFFAPFYLRSSVTTLPDFLEKRYNRACRDLLALLSIFSAVVVHIGFSLLTGAVVLEGTVLPAIVEDPAKFRLYTVLAMCGATAIYTIVGGLLAVVWTESLQTVILLVGAACITWIGLDRIGGWEGLNEAVHPVNLSMLRSGVEPTGVTWYAVLLGYPVLGIWYWCTDQTIVQRVLGAKNEAHARVGPLFAGFLKILPVFLFVLPGVICLGLVNTGNLPGLPAKPDGSPDTEKVYTHMVTSLLSPGYRGIVIAALLAALMSTVSGALNSIATLFSYDIYKRWTGEESDRKLVWIGRVATFVAMCVAVAWTMALSRQDTTIFQAMVDVFPVVAPPTAVVFVWGVFWRGTSARAALITLIAGPLVGMVVFILTLWEILTINSLFMAFLLFVAESIGIVLLSVVLPQRHTAESEKLVWKTPWEPLRRSENARGLLDYRWHAAALVIVMVGLYLGFTQFKTYYPVPVQLTLDGEPVIGARVYLDTGNPRMNDTLVTDVDGRFVYGSETRAGGAPAGTALRLRLEPARDYLLVAQSAKEDGADAEEAKWTVAAWAPAGAKLEEEELSEAELAALGRPGRDGKAIARVRVTLQSGDVSNSVILEKGQRYKLLPASDVPEQFRRFETSPLRIRVRPDESREYVLELDEADVASEVSEPTSPGV